VYAFIIDDLVDVDMSRAKARGYVNGILSGEPTQAEQPVQSIEETQEEFYARRDRELRANWGKTPEQVAEMSRGFSI
jgi:hypothetical protein